jgi:predicted RND superfamily exporter protein
MLEIEARANFPPHVSLHAAGYASLYTRIVERLVSSQITGFSAALVLILLAIAVATRSRERTLLAIPANLIPVGITLGLMGWLGIPLDVATATIATVIIGLIVDDTVHVLRPAAQADTSTVAAIEESVKRAGSSLLMTSVVLCGGFLIMGFAGIRSIAWFGLLTSFAMASAILTDLTLMSALARMGEKYRHRGRENLKSSPQVA